MTKVTQVKAPISGKNYGEFKVEKFSMFEDEDLAKYADLRNRANDRTSGITIEMMREYSRKTTEVEGEGETRVHRTTEEVILVVQYWEKPAVRKRGDSDDEIREAKAMATADGPGVLVPAGAVLSRSGVGR